MSGTLVLTRKLVKSPSVLDMRLKKKYVDGAVSDTLVPNVCIVVMPLNWQSHNPISVIVTALKLPAFQVAV